MPPETTHELGTQKSESSIDAHDEPFLKKVETFCFLVYWPLKQILPVHKLPELTLLLVFFIIYVICEFIVTIMNVLSVYTNMSHFLVGLTLMVWGSDVLELFNMIIATEKKQLELGMTSVLACQVICILVVVPLACLMRMYMRAQTEIQILQSQHTRNQVVLPPIICALLCFGIFFAQKMELNRASAVALIAVYLGYVAYSVTEFYHDE